MNRAEYERAIRDTRKAIYKGNLTGALVGAIRAFVAHNDPEQLPPPRRLTTPMRKALPAAKRKAVKRSR